MEESSKTTYQAWYEELKQKLAVHCAVQAPTAEQPSTSKNSLHGGKLAKKFTKMTDAVQNDFNSRGIDETPKPTIDNAKERPANGKAKNQAKKKKRSRLNQKKLDEQREKRREKQQRYRAKLKLDPTRYEAAKKYERERNQKRRDEGKFKKVEQLTDREKRAARKKWRERKRAQRYKKKEEANLQLNSPTPTPENELALDPPDDNSFMKKEARRRSYNQRKRRNTMISKLQDKVKTLEKHNATLNKRLQRARAKNDQGEIDQSPTPRKAARQVMRAGPSEVRKELTFCCTMKKQLRSNSKLCKTQEGKEHFAAAVSGEVMQKYRLRQKLAEERILSKHLQKRAAEIKGGQRKSRKRMTRVKKLKNHVRNFFLSNENSQIAPGAKDAISKKKRCRNAPKIQKRFLHDTLPRLYKKYKEEFDARISFNSFVRMKPFWVVHRKTSDKDTCRCDKHDNMQFKIAKLHQLELLKVQNITELIKSIACDPKEFTCMHGLCTKCKNKKIPSALLAKNEKNVPSSFWYYEWKKTTVPKKNKKGQTQMKKITRREKIFSDPKSLIKLINSELPSFCKHVYNARHQHVFFKELKENLKKNEAAIIMDFSQNYDCKYASEVQGVHFGGSKGQVCLHTGVIYFSNDSETEKKIVPFCTVSNDPNHKAEAVWAHLQPIIEYTKEKNGDVSEIHFFSDSPSSQYRNKKNFWLFTKKCEELNLKMATWNFSESGHGKNSADGVGGVTKRTANTQVYRFRKDVLNAEQFLERVGHLNIHFLHITTDDIKKIKDCLPAEKQLKVLPGTISMHQMVWQSIRPNVLGVRTLSCGGPCLHLLKCTHYALRSGVMTVRKSLV